MFETSSNRLSEGLESTTLDIAPLIDVVFILLIFFIVTTTFVKDMGIDVVKPSAHKSQTLQPGCLRIYITANESIYIGGDRITLPDCSNRVKKFLTDEADGKVVVVTDKDVKTGCLVAVMDAAKIGGASDIAIATQEER